MKKVLLVLVLGLSIASCHNKPISTSREGLGMEIEYMFEKDGVKVYRFYDGRYHYFTTNGETITTHSTGKTFYDENIKY